MSSVLILAILGACGQPADDHGHAHGGGGGHGEEAGESIAVTRWTGSHELFVELDAPVAAQSFAYHAHVTRMADNHAADSGTLTFRFEQDGFAVESHTDEGVARDGIFARQAMAPGKPGAYRLVFSYADGAERAEWDAGTVTVGAGEPQAHEGEDEGEVGFLKETQWQIPFLVEPAVARAIAPALTAAAIVRPAPGATAVVAAPVEGLLAWSDALPVVGRTVSRGERLATLVPAGAAEHWSRLQADLATARIDRDLAQADLSRVEGLSSEALVSVRRTEEATAAVARANTQVSAAQRRVSVLTSGGAGAVPIRAPADGVIVAVGAAHGESVSAGLPLISVTAGGSVLLEGWVHDRVSATLTPAASLTVMRGDWEAPIDLLASGGRLLTERLIFDAQTLSAPVSVLVEEDVGLAVGDLVELSIGVGSPQPLLAAPRSAVVEINGQDVIFVQKTGESFSRRRVTLGPADATHVAILSGLSEGEMVVVQGGFDVHVASLSGALESHRH
ncbi:MAG: cobalt-zinc-cadmium efflux system membrane fusion protein [Myxococcota bacterium]|jgi:cobalt-zinc-cadmium efflux system membrane fusion protein